MFQKLLLCWGFYTQPSLEFKERGPTEREDPVWGGCVDKMSLIGVRGDWADWFEVT